MKEYIKEKQNNKKVQLKNAFRFKMAEKERYGLMKRFGPRYGRTNKLNFAKIEILQRKLHKCPYCRYERVKRVTNGIWQCTKCNEKFTGRAYYPKAGV